MKIHGLKILAHFDLPDGRGTRTGRVILVDQGDGAFKKYVVAIQHRGSFGGDGNPWDNEWDQGTYCRDMAEAWSSFCSRVDRKIR